jgi:translation elongation factor EF-G
VLRDCEAFPATDTPGHTRLCALTPLSELLGYETELDFLTGGSARLEMGFSHYESLHGGGPDGAA